MKTGAPSAPASDAMVQLSIRFAVLLYLYTKFGGTGTNRNKSVNPNYESGEWDFVGIYRLDDPASTFSRFSI